jgi:hypothetical protein
MDKKIEDGVTIKYNSKGMENIVDPYKPTIPTSEINRIDYQLDQLHNNALVFTYNTLIRFKDVEERLKGLEARFTEIEKRLEIVESRFKKFEKRVEKKLRKGLK